MAFVKKRYFLGVRYSMGYQYGEMCWFPPLETTIRQLGSS